jgi:hypothetical protein
MLDAVIDYLKNDFRLRSVTGRFVIDGGQLQDIHGLEIPDDGYIRIFGSMFNDGVHLYGDDDLTDEEFDGTIWSLAIPAELLRIVHEIEDSMSDAPTPSSVSPMKSESFDGYSYTRATRADGSLMDWRDVYAARLARWRKL